jgi:hypothetical protein
MSLLKEKDRGHKLVNTLSTKIAFLSFSIDQVAVAKASMKVCYK